MCWFITIGVSARGTSAVLALGRERAGLAVRTSMNQSVAALFPRDDLRFELTHRGCSCDFMSGGRDLDGRKSEKMRQRYKAQGWSDAKIARAIQAAERAAKSAHQRGDSAPRELFRQAVIELVRRLGGVRLLAHFYSGSGDDEHVACTERRHISLDEFLQGDLPEDVLVEIIA